MLLMKAGGCHSEWPAQNPHPLLGTALALRDSTGEVQSVCCCCFESCEKDAAKEKAHMVATGAVLGLRSTAARVENDSSRWASL